MKQCLKWKISLEGINNWLDTKKEKKITEFGSIAMETMQTEAQRAKRQKGQIHSVQRTISIRVLSKEEWRKPENYLKKHWQMFLQIWWNLWIYIFKILDSTPSRISKENLTYYSIIFENLWLTVNLKSRIHILCRVKKKSVDF